MGDADTKSPLDKFLTRTKTILEIIAIPVAAYWAFTHFEQSEAPSLKMRYDTQSNLSWFDSTDASECFGRLDMTLKNIGKTNFEIDKVTLRAWVTEAKPEARAVSYFPPAGLSKGIPVEEKIISDQLIGEYRPDQASNEDFIFRFKRRPGQFALVQLDASVKPMKYEEHPNPITEYRWDFVCGELTPKQSTTPELSKP